MKIEVTPKSQFQIGSFSSGMVFLWEGSYWARADVSEMPWNLRPKEHAICFRLSDGLLGLFSLKTEVEIIPDAKLVV